MFETVPPSIGRGRMRPSPSTASACPPMRDSPLGDFRPCAQASAMSGVHSSVLRRDLLLVFHGSDALITLASICWR